MSKPAVAVVMGSKSDMPFMERTCGKLPYCSVHYRPVLSYQNDSIISQERYNEYCAGVFDNFQIRNVTVRIALSRKK